MLTVKSRYTLILLSCLISLGHVSANPTDLTGPYLGQPSPGGKAQVFAPGIVCQPDQWEQYPKWSPDGLEFYYDLSNAAWGGGPGWFYMQGKQDAWTLPVHIGSGTHTPKGVSPLLTSFGLGMGPAFSANGRRVYLMVSGMGEENYNVWMSERKGNDWTEPRNLHLPINPRDEMWWISATNDGTIYITLGKEAENRYTVHWARPNAEGAYPSLESMQTRIATQNVFFHQIAGDESYIILSQWNAGGGRGGYDLWVSFNEGEDQWTWPRNLGPAVNTGIDEMAAYMTGDGKYLFYNTRSGNVQNADIYWIELSAVLPVPDGPIENLNSGQRFASVQCAINFARTGDTIEVGPGLYEESITIEKNITLRSIDPNKPLYVGGTVIHGDGESPVLSLTESADACTIEGLTIRAGSVGIDARGTNIMLKQCRVLDNVEDGVWLSDNKSPSIEGCLIAYNGNIGIHYLPGKGGRGRGKPSHIIRNCIIAGNGHVGVLGGNPDLIDTVVSD